MRERVLKKSVPSAIAVRMVSGAAQTGPNQSERLEDQGGLV